MFILDAIDLRHLHCSTYMLYLSIIGHTVRDDELGDSLKDHGASGHRYGCSQNSNCFGHSPPVSRVVLEIL